MLEKAATNLKNLDNWFIMHKNNLWVSFSNLKNSKEHLVCYLYDLGVRNKSKNFRFGAKETYSLYVTQGIYHKVERQDRLKENIWIIDKDQFVHNHFNNKATNCIRKYRKLINSQFEKRRNINIW